VSSCASSVGRLCTYWIMPTPAPACFSLATCVEGGVAVAGWRRCGGGGGAAVRRCGGVGAGAAHGELRAQALDFAAQLGHVRCGVHLRLHALGDLNGDRAAHCGQRPHLHRHAAATLGGTERLAQGSAVLRVAEHVAGHLSCM
jgi:hypothetical protein